MHETLETAEAELMTMHAVENIKYIYILTSGYRRACFE